MANVIRDYRHEDGVSIVIASNEEGRVEPFLFERREDAERAADQLLGKGSINVAVVYHGVDIMDQHAAQQLVFGIRGLEVVPDGGA